MPITFGSIGDIISLSILIKDTLNCLDDSRGSSAEYQAITRELRNLDRTLLQVELTFQSCARSPELNALRAIAGQTAEQCRACITQFRDQTRSFQRSLQTGHSGNVVKDVASKIKWQASAKRLASFRTEINTHSMTINMLLATAGVKLTTLNDEHINERLKQSEVAYADTSATHASLLAGIKHQIEEQNTIMHSERIKMGELSSRLDVDYFRTLGADHSTLLQEILRESFKTYKAVINVQSRIPSQLDRCWTQEPAVLEDALGRVTPIHLEFVESWEAFEAVLEVRFRQLPGHRKVKQKQYALRANAMNKDLEPSIDFRNSFLPGQRIDMSMVFDGGLERSDSCPGCKLTTEKTADDKSSQIKCLCCGIWYQRIERSPMEYPWHTQPRISDTPQGLPKRWRVEMEPDDEPALFRRVRLRYTNLFSLPYTKSLFSLSTGVFWTDSKQGEVEVLSLDFDITFTSSGRSSHDTLSSLSKPWTNSKQGEVEGLSLNFDTTYTSRGRCSHDPEFSLFPHRWTNSKQGEVEGLSLDVETSSGSRGCHSTDVFWTNSKQGEVEGMSPDFNRTFAQTHPWHDTSSSILDELRSDLGPSDDASRTNSKQGEVEGVSPDLLDIILTWGMHAPQQPLHFIPGLKVPAELRFPENYKRYISLKGHTSMIVFPTQHIYID